MQALNEDNPFRCSFHRFINTIAVCVSGADAVCMVVLTIASMEWKGTDKAKRADKAVVIIQLMVLVGKTVANNSVIDNGCVL